MIGVSALAHGLAGAGGMFGFAEISDTARDLETTLEERGPGAEASRRLQALLARLDELQ